MITDEAVEAAARAAYALRPAVYYLDDCPVSWEELDESGTGKLRKERQLNEARAALEAAAPHMLREAREVAWARGATSAGMNLAALWAAGINPNPYWSDPNKLRNMHQ